MRVSLEWLRELVDIPEAPAETAERLTMTGFEVQGIVEAGMHLSGVVAAEVLGIVPHPSRSDMRVVSVGDGSSKFDVVCGAPNIPDPPGRVVLARVGARVGDRTVERRQIGGVPSAGVLCSEIDLDIGADASGLLVLPGDARPGADVVDLLGLRDVVFDVAVMPNRPDGLGHVGIAREIGAIYGRPVRLPAPVAASYAEGEDPGVTVVVEDPIGCPRYGARVVRGLTAAPSTWKWRYRLHLLGVRAISGLVDVTNLALLLFGQPQHAFDLAEIRGRRIVVRRARAGETMRTLDGVDRTFTSDDLLICDGDGPVAVAGVMGGERSAVGAGTRDVLIECAAFDPRSVRRTSRRLGLASESSYRFERGTDRDGVPAAMEWSAAMMALIGGGWVSGPAIDVGGPAPAPAAVRLRPERIARIIGRTYAAHEIGPTLERLGCRVAAGGSGALDVTPPSWRADLAREIDLIEEIARLRGFDTVPATPPMLAVGRRRRGAYERNRAVRELLAARGLMEAVNHVFADAGPLRVFGAADAEMLRLRNPVAADRAYMRTTLLVGLLGNVANAFARRESSAAFFEIGRTFHAPDVAGRGLPYEQWRLGVVWAGVRPEWLTARPPAWDLHDAAAVLEALGDAVFRRPCSLRSGAAAHESGGGGSSADPPGLSMFHPRAACRVEIGGSDAGICGELHPDVADRFNVPRGTLVMEIRLDAERFDEAPVRVTDLPRFPAVRRDVAAIFDERVLAGDVVAVLREWGPAFLEDARVFDVYRGKPVPEGRKSMAFALVYRAPDRTLTDAEVDAAHARIVDGLVARYRVTIRK